MLDVAFAYLVSAVTVGCVLLLAILVALMTHGRSGVRGRLALVLVGTLLIGIAGYQKMGWSARPWALGSAAQYFDDIMFRVIWLTGLGFVFIAGMMRVLERRAAVTSDHTNGERKLPVLVKKTVSQ